MNNFESMITGIIAVVTALGGSGLGVVIKQMVEAAKVRAEGKKISEDGHAKTQRALQDITGLLQGQLAAEQELARAAVAEAAALRVENTQLRAENAAKEEQIAKLRRDLSNALTLKESAKKKS